MDVGTRVDAAAICVCYQYEQSRVFPKAVRLPDHAAQEPALRSPRPLHSALQKATRDGAEYFYEIRDLGELPPDLPPYDVARRVLGFIHEETRQMVVRLAEDAVRYPQDRGDPMALPERPVTRCLYIDAIGVGLPIYQEIAKHVKADEGMRGLRVQPVVVTGGSNPEFNPGTGAISKEVLVYRVAALLSAGRMSFPADHPLIPKLRHQLSIFQQKISQSGHATFGNTGSGPDAHDDYITALLLSCFFTRRPVTQGPRLMPGAAGAELPEAATAMDRFDPSQWGGTVGKTYDMRLPRGVRLPAGTDVPVWLEERKKKQG